LANEAELGASGFFTYRIAPEVVGENIVNLLTKAGIQRGRKGVRDRKSR
jgi:hypothetical protein